MFGNNQNPLSGSVRTSLEPTFFGKVMTFFALAILSSTAGVFITMEYFMNVFINSPGLMFALYAVELGLIFTSRLWSTKVPLNRFLFVLFSFITGVTIAPLIGILAASPGGLAIVAKALLAATFTYAATGVIGWTTQRDLSGIGGFLLVALLGMIIVGIVGIFIPWGTQFEMIYAGIGIILFAAYTMYDFQKLKHYPQDRYIDAALNLYLDFFNLFLFILRFMLASRD